MLLEQELGAALVILGLLLAAWRYLSGRRGVATHGKVARVEEGDGKSTLAEMKLTIRFLDGEGAMRFFTAASRGTRYRVNDDIPVRYPAANPQKARIDEGAARWVRPLVVTAIGLFLIAAGWLK